MENHAGCAVNKYNDILKSLGDREPRNLVEAKAVIENIRVKKGYLDSEALQELHKVDPQVREKILEIVRSGREGEAAYTTR